MWIWEESGISLISIRSTEALYQSHLNSNNKKLLEHSHWCIATISPLQSTQILFIPLWNINPYWREYSCLLGLVVTTQLHCEFLSCRWYSTDIITIRKLCITSWYLWDYIFTRCVGNLFKSMSLDLPGTGLSHKAMRASTRYPYWSFCLCSSRALTGQHKPQIRRETF